MRSGARNQENRRKNQSLVKLGVQARLLRGAVCIREWNRTSYTSHPVSARGTSSTETPLFCSLYSSDQNNLIKIPSLLDPKPPFLYKFLKRINLLFVCFVLFYFSVEIDGILLSGLPHVTVLYASRVEKSIATGVSSCLLELYLFSRWSLGWSVGCVWQ